MGNPVPLHVLFVDDRKDRFERFRKEYPTDIIDWAQTPEDALYFLAKSIGSDGQLYDEFRLDYHLLTGAVTGSSVAHALACLATYYKGMPVYCHSNTDYAARKMQLILLERGFKDVTVECFDLKYPPPVCVSKWQPTHRPAGMSKREWKKLRHEQKKLAWWQRPAHEVKVTVVADDSSTAIDNADDVAAQWWEYRELQKAEAGGETKATAKPQEESGGGSVSPIVM